MARRRVVLYHPRCVFWTMPLSLIAIGSALDRTRYEVVIIDGRLEDDPIAAVLRAIDDSTICVGVSVLTGLPIRDALGVTRAVRHAHASLPVVWGGWHPSLFPIDCLEEAGITATVAAQGENTLRDIVDRLSRGEDLRGVRGVVHRDARGVPTPEPKRDLAPLDSLPPHDYDLIDVERYFRAKGRRQLDYITSQGCRFRCTFCADPFVYERGWTGLSAERVATELAALDRRYRIENVNLQDETYFTHRERVLEVSERLIAARVGFTWSATMRADQGSRLDADEWRTIKRSGLHRVLVGVESGSQRMIDWMKKDITLDQVFTTAERLVAHGIGGHFPFIVGFPDEDAESVEATLSVVKRLRRMSPHFQTPIYFYQPYPGSPIAELAWQRGVRRPRSLEEWAGFDFVGARGPWVDDALWERIQRFKFYQKHAYNEPRGILRRPLRWLSRARIEHDFLRAPIEKLIVETLAPGEALS